MTQASRAERRDNVEATVPDLLSRAEQGADRGLLRDGLKVLAQEQLVRAEKIKND